VGQLANQECSVCRDTPVSSAAVLTSRPSAITANTA
jgi:hypothetical protein